MKYIKRLVLNKKDQQSNRFAVEADDRIVTTSKVSLQLPSGATSDRPSPIDGQIRFNNSTNDSEIYNASGDGTGWEKVKTNRQTTITPQNLGIGNYDNTLFGPLSYDVSVSKPQNVFVFVDNVYQLPTVNYELIAGNSFSVSPLTVGFTPIFSNDIVVNTTTNVIVGQYVSGFGIVNSTQVTNVDTATNTVSISPATNQDLNDGTSITFSYVSGVFVNFTSAVPAKQVFALLGVDGYAP